MPERESVPVRSVLPSFRRPRVGLALGGGGARGYAHIGVLKVLVREQVPVDYLAGTSMGGVIAAAFAIGKSPAEIEAEALALRTSALVDIGLRRMGLMEGRHVREFLLRFFGDRDIADTTIPLRLTAVDLDNGKEVTLAKGPLVDAIRATISVPGVFCPADWEGRRLLDGGLVNQVPADVVREMGAECVLAVDVGHISFEPLSEEAARRLLSLPGLARLNPLVSTLSRSLDIMQAEMTRDRLEKVKPDVVVRPDLGAVNIEEFDRAGEVIPMGERAAVEQMPRVRAAMRKRLFWR